MKSVLLDNFEGLSGWNVFTSGEAELVLSPERGPDGNAMRLDFDFHRGGGFVVARKAFRLELPEAYSFGFGIRGSAPANILEFKLADETNRNVWRYRVEAFAFKEQWQDVRIRNSRIEFAWGPLGGGPAKEVAAIEFVIAAGPGGKGTVWIRNLRLQDDTYRLTPLVRASSALPGHDPENILTPSDPSNWRSDSSSVPQWLLIDFQQEREFGGLVIHWEKNFQARGFDLQSSLDGLSWSTAYSTALGGRERSYLYLPGAHARYLRLRLYRSMEDRGFGIRGIEVKPHEFSRSINHFFQSIAREHPAGLYPKYFLGRQSYWTVVGTGEGSGQALFNEEGMVEVDKGSFSIMPFLYADGRLITWADVALAQGLERGYLPIPFSEWKTDSLLMKITAFAAEERDGAVLYICYRVENMSDRDRPVILFAAILPFQVTPTWQNWRSFGGVSPIRNLAFQAGALRVNGSKAIIPLGPTAGFGAAAFAEGGIVDFLGRGEVPPQSEIGDDFGYASGAMRFDLDLAPNSTREVVLAIPFGAGEEKTGAGTSVRNASGAEEFHSALKHWESRLDRVRMILPPQARGIADTLRTAAAHILINRDGSELHPGPRRYSRSWIRDGAIMGAALLRLGLAEPMRDFLRWYRQYQGQDGKIPDCVDWEGTEWLPEFDAYGEFIFAIAEYYRFTGDSGFLKEMWPWAAKAVALLEGLRGQRLGEEYRTPEKKAFFGLLPESMSHEGYMAHPVHAYWDDFWALRGLRDAAFMAETLGDRKEAVRLTATGDAFSEDLRASLATAISRHGIDFVPGSVEFGDFDPAATAVAISPLDQLHLLPQPEIGRTFEKYLSGFRERAGGKTDWNNYSAYEIRIIGALIRMGRRREALELIRFMLEDRRIRAWNQWPEISWRDPWGPSFIGDLPHTWISAEFILAVQSMFAYERGADQSLVAAAGLPVDWLEGGFEIGAENLRTHYGSLSYRMRMEGGDRLILNMEGNVTLPKGGIVFQPPLPGAIERVEINGVQTQEITREGFVCRACPAEAVIEMF